MKIVNILKSDEDFTRIQSLLKEFPLTEWDGEVDTFLKFGYKTLSSGAKETYQVLRTLGMNSYKKDKKRGCVCQVSYNFLAISLDTTERTQQNRIVELLNAHLIFKVNKGVSSNVYSVVHHPLPDSTFENTLRKLILRRDCLNIIYEIKDKDKLNSYPEELLKLSKLYKSPFCKKLISSRIPHFEPIKTM